MKLNIIDIIAIVLTVIGGLNWGLVGLMNYNIIAVVFGVSTILSTIVYLLVGLAAIYLAVISVKLERK